MARIILISAFMALGLVSFGQQDCIDDFMGPARDSLALEAPNYAFAINQFFAILRSCDLTRRQRDGMYDLIDSTQQAFASSLRDALSTAEKRREEADAAKQIAIEEARISEANRLAYLSGVQTERQNKADALVLAYAAIDSTKDDPIASARQAFGDAVFLNYSDTLGPYSAGFLSVGFNSTGDRILTRAADGKILTWNMDGQAVDTLSHDAHVYAAAFSPDGNFLLTASADRSAKIWSAEGQVVTLTGHEGPITQARFAPDGERC